MPFNKTCCFAKTRAEKKKSSKEHPIQYKCLTGGQLHVSRMPLNLYGCVHHIYAVPRELLFLSSNLGAQWNTGLLSKTFVYCIWWRRKKTIKLQTWNKDMPGVPKQCRCSLFITSFVHWSSKKTKSNYDVFTLFNILYNYVIWIAKIVLDSLLNNILLQII